MCPRCGEINGIVCDPGLQGQALTEYLKMIGPVTPDAEDIFCHHPAGPFYHLKEEIAPDWAGLVAWMIRHNHWPIVWIGTPL